MNEPYARKVPLEWEHHIADVITETEQALPQRHLISMNISNGQAQVKEPRPRVGLLNFHYAFPPETVALNYGLNRAIGDNETGFRGTGDAYYRKEGWAFILAGGALYNNLDYSFAVGHEDGTFQYPDTQPGGGSRELRRQLRTLHDFMDQLDFVRMRPAADIVAGLPEGVAAQALAESGQQYALYLYRDEPPGEPAAAEARLKLPQGAYEATWVEPETGKEERVMVQSSGELVLKSPSFGQDVAVRIARLQ